MVFGALEAGGTKMVCGILDEKGSIRERVSFPTLTPRETIPQIMEFFRRHKIEALGIGSFGPINPVKGTENYGFITSTPKLKWQYFDMAGTFERELGCPVGFDTDVNASMLGEITYGAAKGLDSCIYITVGTGVGVGIYVNGGLLHGMMHPEAGHILVSRHPKDSYSGKCPFHKGAGQLCCLEGMASGPAIEERFGAKGAQLADRKEVWELEAYYLAQACVNYTLVLSPKRILFGGGVMHQEQLFPLIRKNYRSMMNSYVRTRELEDLETYIMPYSLGDNQGILGCLELARGAMLGKL